MAKKQNTIKTAKKQKTAIVTGGAGFIGSHLVEALIDDGYTVHVIDNLSKGNKALVHKKAKLHVKDVSKQEDIEPLFKQFGKNATVFHLACLARVPFSIDFPRETHESNINGTFNVLLAAKDSGARRVVYSASSSAYGDQSVMPLVETMKPNPKSPYGLHKYVGELYCDIFSKVYGLETVSLRYFNVYGPRQGGAGSYAQAIPKFIEHRKAGKPLTITGDGKQTRDCTHVFDVVRANLAAADSARVGKGEVINIGSGESYSVNYIAELIGGSREYGTARLEPRDTKADIRLAKKLLGWEPKVVLEDGIAELKKHHGI